ncbi:MAG: outer membrane protein assembly factor BamD [Chitinophagaceae bacterium]|jgi:outer membrane protein assembly factor BamD|nr:outer membrane protein assembly factor BamD [Chitinophagaceae bacterium]MCU0403100.1 outer membrane protein assembly factor BamD [Chitinophagaceae bacterium]
MSRILVFLFLAFLFIGCSSVNKVLKSTDYEYKLKKADEYYEKKLYSKAILVYEDIFPVLKGTAQFENLYWNYAFCHYYTKDYLNAENLFKGFIENFPTSVRAEEASFIRAYCYYKQSPKPDLDQTATMKAINNLQTFIIRHPVSEKNKEAMEIIQSLRAKLEEKEKRNAELYYNLGYFKASATAYNELLFNFPDTENGDYYKLMIIKSYYEYAKKSIPAKQLERFEQVLDECADFSDRYPDSKLVTDVNKYKNQTENQLKNIKNEQDKETT